MKNILVAGGAGFIGSNLCKKLLEDKNNKVICLDNLYTGRLKNIKDLLNIPEFNFIKSDIEVFDTDISIDEIYNAACPASPPAYQKNPIKTTTTCVLGTLNLLNLASKHNAKFMQFSTSEVYGNPLVHPQTEEYFGNVNTLGPRACYDEGKRCAESICSDYKRQYNLDIKIARIFNTYGPNMDKDDGRVISNFIIQALTDKNLTIYGDGEQTRSFCYIDDLISGLIKFMSTDNLFGPINIGNPEEFTLNQLISKLSIILNKNLLVEYLPLPKDDPIKRKPDISKANNLLDYIPTINLETGLLKTIEYFKEELQNEN